MPEPYLIVSLCNLHGNPSDAALVAIDTKTGNWKPLRIYLPTWETDFIGFTGLVTTRDGYLLGVQGEPGRLCRVNHCFELSALVDEPAMWDVHGLLVAEDNVYVASTGSDEILQLSLERLELRQAISFEAPGQLGLAAERSWPSRVRAPDPGGGIWHANDLALFCGRPVATRFGISRTDACRAGDVVDIGTGEALFSGLREPHSVTQNENELMLLESATGDLLGIGRGGDGLMIYHNVICRFLGYPRGLACKGGVLAVGRSGFRDRSRSRLGDRRHLPVTARDHDAGANHVAGVYYRLEDAQPFDFVDLSSVGREVYAIVIVDAGEPQHYGELNSLLRAGRTG